ncbi:MAG: hypothetical protein IPK82_36415 [Polyangiaceae bacterium]|nr:hypothetical protein [Polyangiaceae bacterium]
MPRSQFRAQNSIAQTWTAHVGWATFHVMAWSQSRQFLGLAVVLSAPYLAACTAQPSPKTVVDQVASADGPTASDAGKSSSASQTEEVEPVAVPIAGSDLVEAKATGVVKAPIEKLRVAIHKFEDYPQFMPEYSDAKILAPLPSGNSKVYMEITTLGGVAKMYANVEILPARKDGEREVHEARFLDGNVKQFKALWTLKELPADRTELTLQVFLHPSLPLPDFLVNKANLDGAKKGLIAMKKRAEAMP